MSRDRGRAVGMFRLDLANRLTQRRFDRSLDRLLDLEVERKARRTAERDRARSRREAQKARKDARRLRRELNRYREIAGVRELAGSLPLDAVVAVVSRGDDELLRLGRPRAMHLAGDAHGGYLGYHPDDAEQALGQLGEARRRGATHLLVPASGEWWLDHYGELAAHLRERCPEVARNEAGRVFDLRGAM